MARASDSSGRFASIRPETDSNLADRQSGEVENLAQALQRLREDGCVAFPTETVWGLAACALSSRAVERLCAWKGRGEDQPISLLVPGAEDLEEIGFQLSTEACGLMDEFWPGPLTLVLPCYPCLSEGDRPRGWSRGASLQPSSRGSRAVSRGPRGRSGTTDSHESESKRCPPGSE